MVISRDGTETLRTRILLHLKGIEWESVNRMRLVLLPTSTESIGRMIRELEARRLIQVDRSKKDHQIRLAEGRGSTLGHVTGRFAGDPVEKP